MANAVLVAINSGVATLTLNRARAGNTLNKAMGERLRSVVHELEIDDDVHCVAIQSCGPDFLAGIDLGELHLLSQSHSSHGLPLYVWHFMRDFVEAITVLKRMHKPVVVAARGETIGIGLSLFLAGDFRVAANNASFDLGCKETGMSPVGGATTQLAAAIGYSRLQSLALTGEKLSSDDMLQAGIINETMPDSKIEDGLRIIAKNVLDNWSDGCREMKRLLSLSDNSENKRALDEEMAGLIKYLGSEAFRSCLDLAAKKRHERRSA